jgi:hypothetical protein
MTAHQRFCGLMALLLLFADSNVAALPALLAACMR